MTGEQKSATQTKKSSSVLPVLPLERRQLFFRFVLQFLLYELHHVESHSLMRISLIIVGLRWSHELQQ